MLCIWLGYDIFDFKIARNISYFKSIVVDVLEILLELNISLIL
jgi:hypothetical protein